MSKICHAHCPGGSGGGAAAVAVVVAAVVLFAVRRQAEAAAMDMLHIVLVTLAICAGLAAVTVAAIVTVRVRRRAQRAQAARAIPATPVQAALPVRRRAALSAARSIRDTHNAYLITDAAESRVVVERKLGE